MYRATDTQFFAFFCPKNLHFSKLWLIFVHMKRFINILLACILFGQGLLAQEANLSKLSPMLRRYVLQQRTYARLQRTSTHAKSIRAKSSAPLATAFVKFNGDGRKLLEQAHCHIWANWDNIYIATIPMDQIAHLSLQPQVQRIEANEGSSCTMDKAVGNANALSAYEGLSLPQAYTGKGVVMGIMDIGFDLTHPNFFSTDLSEYRIKAFWDQISSDTLQSTLPVGRDYTDQETLLNLGCSRDGHEQNHGTHTLGIAAGSGSEGTPSDKPGTYHGIAYDSDICLVTNATSENQKFIAESQLHKFTYAMDALGFKYIFDYADKVGKPCVISFSEGARQDFDGEDILYGEVLDRLTEAPGHIIVSSAGNNGWTPYYMHKATGRESAGFFVSNNRYYVYHVAKSKDSFTMRTRFYTNNELSATIEVSTSEIFDSPDSTWTQNMEVNGKSFTLTIGAYPSCYDKEDICFDWVVQSTNPQDTNIGGEPQISYEVIGEEADVAVYHGSGNMQRSNITPSLFDADCTHSINSPSCSKSVICVGATVNRPYFVNTKGNKQNDVNAPVGSLAAYSSIGPTFDGRIKPDVVAPGTNIISSNNSSYIASLSDVGDWEISRFDYNGKTYGWCNNAGTSMASPIVGGAVALWLQANPSLTRQDVMRIIAKTSIPLDNTSTIPNNQWGYGMIDVYHGLLAALQLDGIKEISVNQPHKASIHIDKEGFAILEFTEAASSDFTVSIYSIGGTKLKTAHLCRGKKSYRIDLSQLSTGIYAIQITGNKEITGSILIRK